MDKKKGKFKRTMLRRSVGILLVVAVVFNILPVNSLVVSASGDILSVEDKGTGFCKHHRSHTEECGYSKEDNIPCGYECKFCLIEDLIADLPDKVVEDNTDDVQAQMNKILEIYQELTGEEQDQIDISRCLELQETLDATNAPALAEEEKPDLELFG